MSDFNTREIVEFLEKNRIKASFKENRIKLKKGKKVIFDLENREMRIEKFIPWKVKITHSFDTLSNFQLITTERYADATPFQDGFIEYVHTVRLNTEKGKSVNLFHFVDRDEKGNEMLAVLMEMLSKTIA